VAGRRPSRGGREQRPNLRDRHDYEHDIYQEPGRFITSVAVAPDGRWLYFTSADTQSEIWTMRPAR
jgi:WD40 repeat protein